MEPLSLNSSFGSLVDETFFGPMDDEDTLLRRLSPYATLRPGDLTSLLGIQLHSPDANRHKPITGFFADAIVEASEGSTSSGSDDEAEQKSSDEEAVVVRGQDIGDLPAEYVVRGLRPQEMPVIGKHLIVAFVSSPYFGINYVCTRLETIWTRRLTQLKEFVGNFSDAKFRLINRTCQKNIIIR